MHRNSVARAQTCRSGRASRRVRRADGNPTNGGSMPQPRSRRKSEPEAEAEEPETTEEEEAPPEEEFDEDASQDGSNGLNIEVAEDRVVIDLPRDGNERPTLEAIGAMLDSMS
jgi:hypothetical protein